MTEQNLKPLRPQGFDGKTFLTEAEWNTYRRKRSVRYADSDMTKCFDCGKPETKGNELQNAHRIGHAIGIDHVGLTPEALLRDYNIVKAHKKKCNAAVELKTPAAIAEFLLSPDGFGIKPNDFPTYLRKESPVWAALKAA